MNKEFLSVNEVSKYLKLPEETVYKYARDGRMPASKVGRYWRFDRDRLNDWVRGPKQPAGGGEADRYCGR